MCFQYCSLFYILLQTLHCPVRLQVHNINCVECSYFVKHYLLQRPVGAARHLYQHVCKEQRQQVEIFRYNMVGGFYTRRVLMFALPVLQPGAVVEQGGGQAAQAGLARQDQDGEEHAQHITQLVSAVL